MRILDVLESISCLIDIVHGYSAVFSFETLSGKRSIFRRLSIVTLLLAFALGILAVFFGISIEWLALTFLLISIVCAWACAEEFKNIKKSKMA